MAQPGFALVCYRYVVSGDITSAPTIIGTIDDFIDVLTVGPAAEISTFTALAAASLAVVGVNPCKYFTFHDGTTAYYVWFEVGGLGTDPAPGGSTGIKVTLVAENADAVATATRAAINGSAALVAASGSTDKVIITNDNIGPAIDSAAATSGFSLTHDQDGTLAYTNEKVQLWSGIDWMDVGIGTGDTNRMGAGVNNVIKPVVGAKEVRAYPTSAGAMYIGTAENTYIAPVVEDAKILSKSYKVSAKTTTTADVGLLPIEILNAVDHSPVGYGKENVSMGSSLSLGSHTVYDFNTTISPVDGSTKGSGNISGLYWSHGVLVDCAVVYPT